MAQVTVLNMGTPRQVEIEDGETVADALQKAGVDSDSTIRFRGETLDGESLDIVLVPGDTVVATPPDVDHG